VLKGYEERKEKIRRENKKTIDLSKIYQVDDTNIIVIKKIIEQE
jgi:hypothetical protein